MNYSDEFEKLKTDYRILVSPSGEKFLPQIKKLTKKRQRFLKFIYALFYKYPKENEKEFLESLRYKWVDLTNYEFLEEKGAENFIKRHIQRRIDDNFYNWTEKFL